MKTHIRGVVKKKLETKEVDTAENTKRIILIQR